MISRPPFALSIKVITKRDYYSCLFVALKSYLCGAESGGKWYAKELTIMGHPCDKRLVASFPRENEIHYWKVWIVMPHNGLLSRSSNGALAFSMLRLWQSIRDTKRHTSRGYVGKDILLKNIFQQTSCLCDVYDEIRLNKFANLYPIWVVNNRKTDKLPA